MRLFSLIFISSAFSLIANANVLPELKAGNYGTYSYYCGMELILDVNNTRLISIAIDNPLTGVYCRTKGNVDFYTCSSPKKCLINPTPSTQGCTIDVISDSAYTQVCVDSSGSSESVVYTFSGS